MTPPTALILNVLSRALGPAERDAVLGDFAESGEGGWRALLDLLGLVVRRQVALWADWRPWLATIGVALAAGAFLSEIAFHLNVSLGEQLRTYWPYGVHSENGLTLEQNVFRLVCLLLALLVWSWASGFVLGSLSGRTVWLTGPLFYLVLLNSFPALLVLTGAVRLHGPVPLLNLLIPLNLPMILFSLVAVHGAYQGFRWHVLSLHSALVLAAAAASVTVLFLWTGNWIVTAQEAWSGGLWPEKSSGTVRCLPLLLVNWPAVYLLATATRRPRPIHA